MAATELSIGEEITFGTRTIHPYRGAICATVESTTMASVGYATLLAQYLSNEKPL